MRRLVFGAPDPKGGACVSLYRLPEDARLNHRLEVTGGVREAECRELVQEFFQPALGPIPSGGGRKVLASRTLARNRRGQVNDN